MRFASYLVGGIFSLLFLKIEGLQFEYSLNELWLISHIALKKLHFHLIGQPAMLFFFFFYRNFSHLFHFIILANEIPDSAMSKERHYHIILHVAF